MKPAQAIAYIYFLGSGFFTSSTLIREVMELETDSYALAAVSMGFSIPAYFMIRYLQARKKL